MKHPPFLPELFDISQGWNEKTLMKLYELFKNDFIDRKLIFRNKPVKTDNRKGERNLEESFWHLITKKDNRIKDNDRLINYRRIERLPWLRATIENYSHKEVLVWEYEESKSRKRTYLWLKNYDYVVILENKKKTYFLITAYYVEGKSTRIKLQKKYKNRIK